MNIRLRAAVVRQIGNAFIRTHGSHEQESAASARGEFFAEMMGDIHMRERVKPQKRCHPVPVVSKESAGISGACIRDDKADVEIVGGEGELPDEILAGEIKRDDSMLYAVTLAKFSACLLKQILPSRNKDNV